MAVNRIYLNGQGFEKRFHTFSANLSNAYFHTLPTESSPFAGSASGGYNNTGVSCLGLSYSDGFKWYFVNLPGEATGWVKAEHVLGGVSRLLIRFTQSLLRKAAIA